MVDALLTLIFRLGLWLCRSLFCSSCLPKHWLWANAIAQPLNYTDAMPKVIDTQFALWWHGVHDLLMIFCCSVYDLLMLSVDALLTLCWRSGDALLTLCSLSVDALWTLILRSSSIDKHNIAYNGCQYFDYGYMPQHSSWIIQVATPNMVDTLLTLIFSQGMWPCCDVFCS
jgi:hypothetical protein